MLAAYYEDARALERARGSTSGPYLEGFVERLRGEGYATVTIQEYVRAAVHLGLWVQGASIDLSAIDDHAIGQFEAHLRSCTCPGPRPPPRPPPSRGQRITARVNRFREHLSEVGVLRETPTPRDTKDVGPLLTGFNSWMRQHRGATPSTLRIYGRILIDAVTEFGDDLHGFNVRALRAFVLDRSKRHGRSKAKLVTTAMRMFLRYLIASGLCPADLDGAIPTIARWRLASLPRHLSSSEVDRVIATCDPATPVGLRNRAILLLLVRLGLRAGEVATLRIVDIDWHGATVQVAGKSRRASRLPLPQQVGDAIQAYLWQGRPNVPVETVFLRAIAPWRSLTGHGVTTVAGRAIRNAGVVVPVRGAHALRHSAAAEMLRQGGSLDQIRVVLRHRDAETTAHYAKVDLALLRRVAQPWPEVKPC